MAKGRNALGHGSRHGPRDADRALRNLLLPQFVGALSTSTRIHDVGYLLGSV
jgi:hypothetical protein